MNKLIATFFGIGFLKPAPGTWGSLVALPLFWVVFHFGGLWGTIFIGLILFYIGWRATEHYSLQTKSHDASEVVIDEVVGQFIALLPVAVGAGVMEIDISRLWPGWICAFVLFRAFDIFKPGIVGRFDRRSSALSVMLDDVFAGVFAAVGVVVMAGVFHGFA